MIPFTVNFDLPFLNFKLVFSLLIFLCTCKNFTLFKASKVLDFNVDFLLISYLNSIKWLDYNVTLCFYPANFNILCIVPLDL